MKMVGGSGRCSPFVGWGAPCGCWCWAVLTIGRGRWWVVFVVGMGSWWAMFVICRGSVGAGSGPLSPLVGWCWAIVIVRGHWFMGWCWAMFAVGGVVLVVGHSHCHWWGGAGSGLLSSLLVGWCWAVFTICGVVLVVGHCRCHWWGGAGPLSSFVGTVSWVVVLGHVCHSWGGAGPLSVFMGWCWAWVLVANAGW